MFYNHITTRHSRLLNRYNQGLIELGGYTEIPGTSPPAYEATYVPVSGIARGVSPEYADGSTILVTDMTVQIGADVVPTLEHVVRIKGKDHSIMRIEPLPSAGEPVGYILLVRRG